MRRIHDRILGVGEAIMDLGLIFAVHHERDAEHSRHPRAEYFLTENEGLERVEQIDKCETGQCPMHLRVRREKRVVKPNLLPSLNVSPTDVGIGMRRPSHDQRVHVVFRLKKMGDEDAVLAAASGNDDVIAAIVAAVPIADLPQLALAFRPVYGFLVLGVFAGITDAVVAERGRLRIGNRFLAEFRTGDRPLVGDHAFPAKDDVPWEAMHDCQVLLFRRFVDLT